MPIIAIAGGTSPSLGRSLVHAIQQTSNTPIILSRQSPNAPQIAYNAPVRQIIYTNHISLVEALRGVQTVISVIKTSGPEWAEHQINLLRAAKVAGVKRFAPSEFGLGPLQPGHLDELGVKEHVWVECERSGLEATRFCCGIFMNVLGLGINYAGNADREIEARAGLRENPIIWDVAAGTAVEPVKDDGCSLMITLTDIWDVGRFVAAACELPLGSWENSMGMVGQTLTISDVTELIGKVSGRSFKVSKVRLSELAKQRNSTPNPRSRQDEMITKMVAQFEILGMEDWNGTGIIDPLLNRLCPGIQPKSVEQYLQNCQT